jgi:hypothetical protein
MNGTSYNFAWPSFLTQEISINLKNRTLLQDASDLLSYSHVYGCNAASPSGLALTEEELHRSADQST